MSRLSRNYLGLTFLIMLICWGTCFLCSLAGISLENNKLLYLPYLLGGLSPTIASYLALRRGGGTANLKEWLKSIFDFKHYIFSYLMVVVVAVMFILPQCSAIWWLWHLPLFYIQGTGQYGQDYFAFGISVLGMSFALAGIRKSTGSIWLCVLFHSIVNSLMGIYILNDNIWGNIAAAVVMIVCSYALVNISGKTKMFHK